MVCWQWIPHQIIHTTLQTQKQNLWCKHDKDIHQQAIIFVRDDDVIKQTNISKHETMEGEFKLVVKYLLEKVNRMISNYTEDLPQKAKWQFFPHLIWILPPPHKYLANNILCECYNWAMAEEVSNYPAMCALCLKKVWDEKDGALYMQEQRRYTPTGLDYYWQAIDVAIKFWDRTLQEIMMKRQKKTNLRA